VIRITNVRHVDGLAEELAKLPEEVSEVLYEQLTGWRDRELPGGEHLEMLLIEGRAVRVNFFVDTDGTLWIERLAVGGS
jgi:hypothetical protein